MAAPTQKVINTENLRSVVSGGTLPGWTPESAVVLWRRMLGSLGDINKIDDPENYAQVLEYLCDLTDVLIKVTNPLVQVLQMLSIPYCRHFQSLNEKCRIGAHFLKGCN